MLVSGSHFIEEDLINVKILLLYYYPTTKYYSSNSTPDKFNTYAQREWYKRKPI